MPNLDARISDLLQRHPSLARPPQYHSEPPHQVFYHIDTTGPPVYQKPRCLQLYVEKEVRDQFQTMVKNGIYHPSSSQWSSPLVIVRNKNKPIRIVGDYNRLNA